ncbi:MAG: choice-of-anchor B family protein [Planctomycetota bacterium]|jgi:choice-of-anchor B domain-containing protein
MRFTSGFALSATIATLALTGCVDDDDDPVAPPPLQIHVSSDTLSFTAQEASAAVLSQALNVTRSGTGTANWTATDSAAWLSVAPATGTGAVTVSIDADTTGLDPGVYVEPIDFAAPGAVNSPQTVTVTLTITEKPDKQAPSGSKLQVVGFTLDKSVPTNPKPLLTFARDLDLTTVTSTNLALTVTAGGAAVSYTSSYASANRQLTLTPTSPLAAGTQYTITATTSLQDTGGNTLDQDDFTTGGQPFTQNFDTTMPMLRLKGHVPMSGVGDVWIDGNFVYVAGRTTGANGIYIVDATDIANPKVAKILGGVGFVQDVKVFNGIMYHTVEPGGVRLWNVSNPYNPVSITTINDSFVSDPHNVWVSGSLLFVAETGSTKKVEVYDISTPATPVHRSSISSGNTGWLIHDMVAFNNKVYAGFLSGGFSIIDISTPTSPSTVVDHTYTGNFTHSAWPSPNGNVLYTTDEKAGGPLRIWNISTPSSPSQIATYTANSNLSIHNAQVDGNLVFISFYQAGLRVLDVTTPASPREIAWFDTFPGQDSTSGTFNGMWGAHRVGSMIACSDMGTGLYLFRYTP